MAQFTQIVNENVNYEQDIVGDTISSAVWSTNIPANPGIVPQAPTATAAVAAFESDSPGTFVLSVELQLASGQVRVGQARIQVVQDIV